jgi:hypothetical protein
MASGVFLSGELPLHLDLLLFDCLQLPLLVLKSIRQCFLLQIHVKIGIVSQIILICLLLTDG